MKLRITSSRVVTCSRRATRLTTGMRATPATVGAIASTSMPSTRFPSQETVESDWA
jgi:hypothetical protein